MTTQAEAFVEAVKKVTQRWAKQKKAEERSLSAYLNRASAQSHRRRVTLKEAAYAVMPEAYAKASDSSRLPAHARQIMYAARGRILELTGQTALNDAYFTQVLLPDFMAETPDAQSWDVVYDARGQLEEPHTDRVVRLGTLQVREYLRAIDAHEVTAPTVFTDDAYPTHGPGHRYAAILFCEKEGFLPLFNAVKLAERYDIAVMSTKGVSNVASRQLIDSVCGGVEIPLLVLHDFDAAGFTILGTLTEGTRRYAFENCHEVVDLGLRLSDVRKYGLEPEPSKPRISEEVLANYGATDEEIAFLESQRVELNAFASAALVEWIEGKLVEHGVKKVIPGTATLQAAYRRAVEVRELQRLFEDRRNDVRTAAANTRVPKDLEARVAQLVEATPELPWDAAVARIVAENSAS